MFIHMNEMFAHILGKDLIGEAQMGYVDKLEHQLCFVPARYKVGYSTKFKSYTKGSKSNIDNIFINRTVILYIF